MFSKCYIFIISSTLFKEFWFPPFTIKTFLCICSITLNQNLCYFWIMILHFCLNIHYIIFLSLIFTCRRAKICKLISQFFFCFLNCTFFPYICWIFYSFRIFIVFLLSSYLQKCERPSARDDLSALSLFSFPYTAVTSSSDWCTPE